MMAARGPCFYPGFLVESGETGSFGHPHVAPFFLYEGAKFWPNFASVFQIVNETVA